MAEGDMKKGSMKWFNDQKGFGFITPDDGGEEFVHQSAIKSEGFRSLGEGEEVGFTVEYGGDGRAKVANVTGPEGSSVQGSTRGGSYGGRSGDGPEADTMEAAGAAVDTTEAAGAAGAVVTVVVAVDMAAVVTVRLLLQI